MSIRTLPPAGSRIFLRDLLRCLETRDRRQTSRQSLIQHLCSYFELPHVFLFSHGRSAMTILLEAVKRSSAEDDRDIVIIPSFTCYSVVASVMRAGLRVQVCDIDPKTLGYDMGQLNQIDFTRVIAIVTSSLFGMPNDMKALEQLSASAGVYLIDDAAQSFGAEYGGRPVGAFGDAGILSFDKGKSLTAINGGAIVTRHRHLADSLNEMSRSIPKMGVMTELYEFAKLLIYWALLRPELYWVPRSLPFLKLGETVYDDTFFITQFNEFMSPVLLGQLERLPDTLHQRRSRALQYKNLLPEHDEIKFFNEIPDTNPSYLRFPFRITNATVRLNFLESARRLGVSISYPKSVAQIPGLADRLIAREDQYYEGAKISQQIVTLPTHPFVENKDIIEIEQFLINSLNIN